MSVADEIAKMDALRKSGAITEAEYETAKAALLENGLTSNQPATEAPPRPEPTYNRPVSSGAAAVNNYAMFIHLSCLCGLIIPLAGLIVPIVLWQVKKDESRLIDLHGRIVVNWIITMVIAAFVCGVLTVLMVGAPLFFALIVLGIIFPIVGGVKASGGEIWRYPLSIPFISDP